MPERYDIVILGLALSSSWGNGHATTYRALIKGLAMRGRRVLFLERERPWYADHRDFTSSPHCRLVIYHDLEELVRVHAAAVSDASAVIVGSYVPDGIEVARWVLSQARGVRAFYDIDTPVTLQRLVDGDCDYLSRDLIPEFDLYLSFTGGPTLTRLTRDWGARRAAALYCSVDAGLHRPARARARVDLGYLGTYSADRQPRLEELLIESARRAPARSFVVAGAQYPPHSWPANVRHVKHLPQSQHVQFYSGQRFTLNLTRDAMIAAGHSPSVRLFEAAACGVPIITDVWAGIDELFVPGREIVLAERSDDVLETLGGFDEKRRRAMAIAARARVLAEHTGERRAAQLDALLELPAIPAARLRKEAQRSGALRDARL
jgi:spore maturation protein CgeB